MRQYDVTDPRKPKLAGSVHIGGIARRTPHPNGKVYAGGPQMVEISRDGKRVYWTNSLYSTWDNQFYPDGVPGAEVMANANASGGLELAKDYWVSFPDGYRAHQIPARDGEPLDLVARQTNVSIARLTEWRDRALAGAATALKERERDDRDDEIARLKSKVGEITMDNELLNAKIAALEGKRPLAHRRSRR